MPLIGLQELARRNHDCPHCLAFAGEPCRMPCGRDTSVHRARIRQISREEAEQARVRTDTIEELLREEG